MGDENLDDFLPYRGWACPGCGNLRRRGLIETMYSDRRACPRCGAQCSSVYEHPTEDDEALAPEDDSTKPARDDYAIPPQGFGHHVEERIGDTTVNTGALICVTLAVVPPRKCHGPPVAPSAQEITEAVDRCCEIISLYAKAACWVPPEKDEGKKQ